MRALQTRLASGIRDGTLSEEVAQEASSPMRKLKSIFPNAPLAKHAPFDIFLSAPSSTKPRALVFQDLGSIENDWVATEFVLHYFEGDGPSPPVSSLLSTHMPSYLSRRLVEKSCPRTCQSDREVIVDLTHFFRFTYIEDGYFLCGKGFEVGIYKSLQCIPTYR